MTITGAAAQRWDWGLLQPRGPQWPQYTRHPRLFGSDCPIWLICCVHQGFVRIKFGVRSPRLGVLLCRTPCCVQHGLCIHVAGFHLPASRLQEATCVHSNKRWKTNRCGPSSSPLSRHKNKHAQQNARKKHSSTYWEAQLVFNICSYTS